jgi:hypothetical protein
MTTIIVLMLLPADFFLTGFVSASEVTATDTLRIVVQFLLRLSLSPDNGGYLLFSLNLHPISDPGVQYRQLASLKIWIS